MKKAVISLAIVLMFLPVISHGATKQDLEKQQIQLLEQIIVMLKAQLQELIVKKKAITPTSIVSASVVTASTTGTSTITTTKTGTSTSPAKIVKKKRSGGGGGGGSSSRGSSPTEQVLPLLSIVTPVATSTPVVEPFVPTEAVFVLASSRFGIIIPVHVVFAEESITAIMDQHALPFWVTLPSTYTIKVQLTDTTFVDAVMARQGSSLVYRADMSAAIGDRAQYKPDLAAIVTETVKELTVEYELIELGALTILDVLPSEDTDWPEETEDLFPEYALELQSSDEDPDATTLVLNEDENTEYTIFAFDLSAEDSEGDIALNEVGVNVVVTGVTSIDAIVNDFRLEIDGQSFDVETYTGAATTATLVFDIDGDVVVTAGEIMTAILYADFENMDNDAFEASTIQAYIGPETIVGEGETNMTAYGLPVIGSVYTLRTSGVEVELVDSNKLLKVNSDETTSDDEGVFEIVFEITVLGDDHAYLPFGASNGSGSPVGVQYSIVNPDGAVTTTGTYVSAFIGNNQEGNFYRIDEWETESFELAVEFDPSIAGSYALQITGINFGAASEGTTDFLDVTDLDIKTDFLTILN